LRQLLAEHGADAQRYSVRREVLHAVRPTGAVGRLGSRVCFAGNPDQAIFRYNNASHYGRAVKDYAAVLAADHGAFAGFTAETSSLKTTAGDVLLPIGYASESPVPVNEYLATHPQ
jgi:hypothetical protein